MSYRSTTPTTQFKTLIYKEELDHIAGWVEEYPDLETGGDLFGFWTHSGFPVIQFVLGPGKTSRHNVASFYQDREHLIKAGEILRSKHGLQHIGEWHSHHRMGLAQPSSGDEQTVFNALRQYNFSKFLLCIANFSVANQSFNLTQDQYIVNIGCFLFTPSYSHYRTGSWVVLPEQSPIRRDISMVWGTNRSLFESPRLNKKWQVDQTTLEAEALVSTEPISIADNVWYSTPEGQALLKEIYEGLKRHYQNLEMLRNPANEIYFKFENNHNHKHDKFRIDFPQDFPKKSPTIKINHRQAVGIKGWEENSQYLYQIEACIERYYQGKWQ